MSHVEFKKWQCRRVEFSGPDPLNMVKTQSYRVKTTPKLVVPPPPPPPRSACVIRWPQSTMCWSEETSPPPPFRRGKTSHAPPPPLSRDQSQAFINSKFLNFANFDKSGFSEHFPIGTNALGKFLELHLVRHRINISINSVAKSLLGLDFRHVLFTRKYLAGNSARRLVDR